MLRFGLICAVWIRGWSCPRGRAKFVDERIEEAR